MKAEVRVTKAGPGGKPQVQVAVPRDATPDQIAEMVRLVYISPGIYNAGGVRVCLGCKSGIDVSVVDSFPESIFVGTEG
jgi:hypothetical protein